MAADDIVVASLKVAELKDHLSARQLSTSGLKKDLAQRLQEAIDAESRHDEITPQEDSQAVDTTKSIVEPVPEPTVELATVRDASPAPHPEASEAVKATAQAEAVIEKLEESESAEIAANEDTVKEDPPPKVEEDVEAVVEQRVFEDSAEAIDDPLLAPEEKTFPGAVRNAQATGMEAALPSISNKDESLQTTSRKRDADSMLQEDTEDDEDKQDRKKEEDKVVTLPRLQISHPDGLSAHTDPPSPLTSTESSSTHALNSEKIARLNEPKRTLYLTGLVRPLTVPSLRMRVEEFGKLGGAGLGEGQELWLDGVKTHAYVTYQTVDEAQKAREALHGSIFPAETGGTISAYFVPTEFVPLCIEIEQTAWEEARGKMELRARVKEDENSPNPSLSILLFSLHRTDLQGPSLSTRVGTQQGGAVAARTASNSRPRNALRAPRGPEREDDRGFARNGRGYSSSYAGSQPPPQRFNGVPIPTMSERARNFDVSSREKRWGDRGSDDRRYPPSGNLSRDHDRGYGMVSEVGPSRRSDDRSSGRTERDRATDRLREVEERIRLERERGLRDGGDRRSRDAYEKRPRYHPYAGPRYDRGLGGRPELTRPRERPMERERDHERNLDRAGVSKQYERRPSPPMRGESGRDEFGRDRPFNRDE